MKAVYPRPLTSGTAFLLEIISYCTWLYFHQSIETRSAPGGAARVALCLFSPFVADSRAVPVSTCVRMLSRCCAPGGDQRIRCFFTKRRLTTALTADLAIALEILHGPFVTGGQPSDDESDPRFRRRL
jgi:hypothetical protein